MANSQTNVVIGSITSTGAAYNLNLGFIPDEFETWNQTNQSSTANPGVVKKSVWFNGMANASALVVKNTAGAATDESSIITTGGFTPISGASAQQTFGSAVTISSVSQAASALVTTSSPHGLAVGDVVALFNVTGQQQISGMQFTVLTVPLTTTFTIPLDSSGFANAGSGGTMRKVILYSAWNPAEVSITKITQATSLVVTTSVAHGYSSGDVYRLHVPAAYGMVQADQLQAAITVLSTTTFSMPIDSTAFTAFAFPLTGAFQASRATVVPVGENGTALTDSIDNTSFLGIQLGTAVAGATSDVIWYRATHGF